MTIHKLLSAASPSSSSSSSSLFTLLSTGLSPSTMTHEEDESIDKQCDDSSHSLDTQLVISTLQDYEFDGTTVLCRVCGDKASGFHYGVHSCEGCKGFFRRSIQQKIQYRPCTKNQQCSILRINRNRCQYCRLKKCIAVGMSRDAVRFGRVPKREKAKILAAMQKVNAHSMEKALCVVLEDENNLSAAIIKAHEETCDYTHDKVAPLLDAARSRPIYAQCPPQMTCPLNPMPQNTMETSGAASRILEDFSERFSPAIRGVVEFAKRIPGFNMLSQEDQVTLLKAGVFEVLLVRLACMFDTQTNSMVCLNGLVLRRDSLHSASNARFLMDSMFEFAERLNALRLTDQEIGLFCAVIVIAPDRPGIRNIDLVQKINKRLEEVLQKAIAAKHPESHGNTLFMELTKKIPDLRTLNTLHSEKLLDKSFGVIDSSEVASSTTPVSIGSNHMDHLHHHSSPASSTIVVQQPQPDSQSDNSPDRWSSSSSSSLMMGHFSPNSTDDNRRSVSPSHHDWNDSKDGACFGSPRSMSSSSGVSSDDSLSRKGSISLSSAPPKLAYINSYVRGLSSTMVIEPSHQEDNLSHHHPYTTGKMNRVDSPTDSGIESGKEHGSSSTPTTSVCSSPRSAIEDKLTISMKDVTSDSESTVSEKQESIDDMPVLKRALQAPPLVNTNKLMDEAYRHHKKFRAARRDTEPHSPSTTTGVLVSRLPEVSTSLSASTSPCPHQSSSLASTHSTLLKTLEQPSRYLNEQQLKRTDLIHNIIMNTEAVNTPALPAPTMKELPVTTVVYPAQSYHAHSPQSSMEQHVLYAPVTTTSSVVSAVKDNVTVMYPPGYYHMPVVTPATGCPFGAGRNASPSAHHHAPQYQHLSVYHSAPISRTTPSPSYLENVGSPSPLLVIGSPSAAAASTPSPSRPLHTQSPYSHLQRCLTATTAPPSVALIVPQTASDGGVLNNNDIDAQPLNLSKKASPANSHPVKMELE